MKRARKLAFRVAVAAAVLCFMGSEIRAQAPASSSAAPAPAKAPEPEQNPFAAVPAPPLPPGMTGSDVNDPRYKLAPGLYDAGETSMGLKHLLLLKKPAA
ncbi:MAG: hypothetical protein ACRD52_19145, partial [Candidatus Acidiferrales bacterium]